VRTLSATPLHFGPQVERLPLATLYLTERCNSRCITCDYWRHGRADMSLETVTQLLPSLARLETQVVLLSGGEPLLNPNGRRFAQLLKANGLQLWLLTSGLSLVKHAHRAGQLFDAITVSLDGTNRETYAAIRGLDAFDNVCAGIRAGRGHRDPGRRARHCPARQLPAAAGVSSNLRDKRAPGRFRFSLSTWQALMPLAAPMTSVQTSPCIRRTCPYSSRFCAPWRTTSADAFHSGFNRGEPAPAAAHSSIFLRRLRDCGLPAGALQTHPSSLRSSARRAVSALASSLADPPMPSGARISREVP